jgi:triacylglycerol lipase
MIDDRTALMGDEYPLAGQFVWTREDNRFGWDALLDGAPGSPQLSPYAAAARSDNLSGLPPTYIAVGALDLFLNENLAYAARLIAAGVPVELHVYPGAFHGFEIMPQAHVSVSAARNSLEALHKAFCG